MNQRSVLVQPVSQHALASSEQRASERRVSDRRGTNLEALTRPLETQDTLWWGAVIRNLSPTGIGLSLCYPFRPGTYLAIDMQAPGGTGRTFLTRVVHVQDKSDGTWHVGCEFVKKLTESDLEMLV